MKSLVVLLGLLAASSSAFAEAGRPIQQGNKCWALTDTRGFGYWDKCASGDLLATRNRERGLNRRIPRAMSQIDLYDYNGAGGAGGGGGGGGNGR